MAKAVRFYEAGGPDVLRLEDVPVGEPGEGEVRVRHEAVGLNFADTYFRQGYYPVPLPNGMGVEAAGVIEAPSGDEIKQDLTLEPIDGKKGFVINRSVFVGEDVGGKASPASGKKRVTLTIKPGTQLFGADNLSFMSINRGSKIVAEGTKDKPVVFLATSSLRSR